MLIVHHLRDSQSERIVWLCEELGLPYQVVAYDRDPVTRLSPPALRAMHPLGAAPLLQDGDLLLAESAAIVEYIIEVHGGGRLRVEPGAASYTAYLYWFHFANGNLQPTIFRLMTADKPSTRERVDLVMKLIDARLAEVDYLAGEFSAADIMSVFSLTTMRKFQPVDLTPYAHIRAYLARIAERPAYQLTRRA